jgi:hypothetical protein
MTGAVKSELRKFFTTRMWWGMAIGVFLAGAPPGERVSAVTAGQANGLIIDPDGRTLAQLAVSGVVDWSDSGLSITLVAPIKPGTTVHVRGKLGDVRTGNPESAFAEEVERARLGRGVRQAGERGPVGVKIGHIAQRVGAAGDLGQIERVLGRRSGLPAGQDLNAIDDRGGGICLAAFADSDWGVGPKDRGLVALDDLVGR